MSGKHRLMSLLILVLFAASVMSGCSMSDVPGMKLGKYAQTLTVSKDDLSGKIKSQYGAFTFSEKQIAKIKTLKNIKKMKSKKDIKKNTYVTSKTIKGKKVTISVTRIGKSTYQLMLAIL